MRFGSWRAEYRTSMPSRLAMPNVEARSHALLAPPMTQRTQPQMTQITSPQMAQINADAIWIVVGRTPRIDGEPSCHAVRGPLRTQTNGAADDADKRRCGLDRGEQNAARRWRAVLRWQLQ